MTPKRPADEPDLLKELNLALSDESPLAMLSAASTIGFAASSDTEPTPPMPVNVTTLRSSTPSENLMQITSAMLDFRDPATDALLLIWSHMFDDEFLRKRIRSTVKLHKSVPRWVHSLDDIAPVAAMSIRSPLKHEETIFIEYSLAGETVTAAVAVTRLGIPYLEDAYFTNDTIAQVRSFSTGDPEIPVDHIDLSLADARAQVAAYAEHGDHMMPPTETDTWPSESLLLMWLLELLPAGGTGAEVERPSEEELRVLVDEFLASPWAKGLDNEAWMHAERIFDLQVDYGTGDPLRWGATMVNMIMGDLYPRKVMADEKFMLSMPDVLRGLVQFANERSGISEEFTRSALEAIDEMLPDYRNAVSGKPSNDPAAALGLPPGVEVPPELMAELSNLGIFPGDLDSDEDDGWDELSDWDPSSFWKQRLLERVGSEENLNSLTADPLSAERFTTEGINPKVLPQVEALAADLAAFADAHFQDPEMTTAVLRTLNRTANSNPAAFRRGLAHEPAIAALCWIAGKNNRWFDQMDEERTIQTMTRAVGTTTAPNSRAQTMLKHFPRAAYSSDLDLGDPELLTSWARADIIEDRDELLE